MGDIEGMCFVGMLLTATLKGLALSSCRKLAVTSFVLSCLTSKADRTKHILIYNESTGGINVM